MQPPLVGNLRWALGKEDRRTRRGCRAAMGVPRGRLEKSGTRDTLEKGVGRDARGLRQQMLCKQDVEISRSPKRAGLAGRVQRESTDELRRAPDSSFRS